MKLSVSHKGGFLRNVQQCQGFIVDSSTLTFHQKVLLFACPGKIQVTSRVFPIPTINQSS